MAGYCDVVTIVHQLSSSVVYSRIDTKSYDKAPLCSLEYPVAIEQLTIL